MQLRDLAASKRDMLMIDPRIIQVEEGYNIRDLRTPDAQSKLMDLARSIADQPFPTYQGALIEGQNALQQQGQQQAIQASTGYQPYLNWATNQTGNASQYGAPVAALANQKFTTSGGDEIDGTFTNFFSQSVSSLGQSLSGANARVDDQSNIEQLVRSQRDGASGVSLDEELADLMKFQRAFQASSRVFSVIDELLDNVVNSLGR
jgi:flagellar hook-associated protein FlgK